MTPAAICMDRATRAAFTLDEHAELVGDSGADQQTQLTDLLADLMHLCINAHIGTDFDAALELARRHFDAE